MDTIIFDTSVDGHHLEYLHHIYNLCKEKDNSKYVFLIPEEFEKIKLYRDWPKADNILFDYIKSDEIMSLKKADSFWRRQIILSSIINSKCKEHGIYNVFTNSILMLMPFAPLFLMRKVRLSGIIYDIYDYQQQNHSTWLSKIPLWLCYQMMSHSKFYRTLFILNDELAPARLNKKFCTRKFKYVPDPYVPLPTPKEDIRETFKIPANNKVYAHIGSMSIRKGTLVCLDAISMLSEEEKSNCTFIFAGHFGHFKSEFDYKLNNLNLNANIIIHDEFCSYELLAAICAASDYILVPYLETMRSSGIIGYAAQFNKPVIGPMSGLMGYLIDHYQLGEQLAECSAENLSSLLRQSLINDSYHTESDYCISHTIKSFQDAIEVAF